MVKNALAPLAGSSKRERGCLGLDGDIQEVLRALGDLAPGLEAIGQRLGGATVLELGPGRSPELGTAMILAGAADLVALDVDLRVPADALDLGRYGELTAALAGDHAGAAAFRTAAGSSPAMVESRASSLMAQELPAQFANYDGHLIPLPDSSCDLAFSNAVLEHVPANAVLPLLSELRRVLKPTGGMVHIVDLRDHTHVSGSAGTHGDWLEALRYSDRLFEAMFSRRSSHINRLRAPEWRASLELAGFSIVEWHERRFPLSPAFRRDRIREPWDSLDEVTLSIGGLRMAVQPSD